MRKVWYRKFLIFVLVVGTIFGGVLSVGMLQREYRKEEASAATVSEGVVIPGGMPIGIYMETNGVMILGTEQLEGMDGLHHCPAEHVVKAGDYIVGMNGENVENKNMLLACVKNLESEDAVLTLRRDGEVFDVKVKPVKTGSREYKLGIWVRDNAQGLGTITFLTNNSKFGALGHGIHDVDTNQLLDIKEGKLYATSIKDIQKGERGIPGGIEGIIVYNRHNMLGSIEQNTDAGIYGTADEVNVLFRDQTPMEICPKEEIEKGNAKIRCAVDGTVKDYDVQILSTDMGCREVNKGIVLEVTDSELLKLTGGIVQGMSGSPIIQNGRLIGAVTHVFVQDATKGYGIFIENMLEHVK